MLVFGLNLLVRVPHNHTIDERRSNLTPKREVEALKAFASDSTFWLLTENLFDGEKTRTERVTIQEDAGLVFGLKKKKKNTERESRDIALTLG